jgi:CRP-like cAMP-binding protein
MLSIVDKVIALQDVDVFSDIASEQLAHLATISEEVTLEAGHVIYRRDDPSDALYLVLEGQVRLHRDDAEVSVAAAQDVFGAWALFDDAARMAGATVTDDAHLLRIRREDFLDLLTDHGHITQGVFKALVGRLRGLVDRVDDELARHDAPRD